MSLFKKLFLSFFVLNILTLGIGFFSTKQVTNTAVFIQEVYDKPLQSINFARTAQNDFTQMQMFLYKVSNNKAFDEDSLEEVNDNLELFEENLEIAQERAISQDSKDSLIAINADIKKWRSIKDDIFTQHVKYRDIEGVSDSIQSNLADLVEFEATAGYDFVIDIQNTAHFTKKKTTIITAIVAGFGFILAIFLSFNITKPVKSCVKIAESIAKGKFDNDIKVKRKDEMGKLLTSLDIMQKNLAQHLEEQENIRKAQEEKESKQRKKLLNSISSDLNTSMGKAISTIRGTVGGLTKVANELSEVSQQSLAKSDNTSYNMENVGHNIGSVAAATEQLSASISDITENTNQSSSLAMSVATRAQESHKIVERLAKTSEDIGSILSFINDIANQINLLALNATIEAARAGEAGKGFSVVASEVKNLASQTGEATEDIKLQVDSIQEVTKQVVMSIDDIMKSVDEVQKISGTNAQAMNDQSSATSEISRMVQDVSVKTNESVNNMREVKDSANVTKNSAEKVIVETQQLSNEMENFQSVVKSLVDKIQSA